MPDALVDVGELRAPGTGPGGRAWRVGLEHPAAPDRHHRLAIEVERAGVATSAGRAGPFTADAHRHHIIDPRTGGCPPADRAASVVAPTATAADALATALTLLPRDAAAALLRRSGPAHAFLSEPGHMPRLLS